MKTLLVSAIGLLVFACLISCREQNASGKSGVTTVVETLIEAYEKQDAQAYWNEFNEKLKSKVTLEELYTTLRYNNETYGKMLSYRMDSSDDSSRAVIELHFERGTFDAHLRIDEHGKLARLTWLGRKTELANPLTAEETIAVKNRFSAVTKTLIGALEDTSGEAVYDLLSQGEQSGWSKSDCADLLLDVYSKCGSFVKALEIEPVSANRIVLPLEFQSSILAFTFSLDPSDRIYDVRISNYAPRELQNDEAPEMGPLAKLTSDLTGYQQLKSEFNSDSGIVRLVAILSPT